ncbi:MAG: Jag N-terminal domain-containing protein [Desulfovibrio sp.]|nr:Jag N-terminal domain-containing protein [Desulfovibrio sp.]MCA1985139.1 Jag N-terminal domain-containing protein [Desulfovibrio sp.]
MDEFRTFEGKSIDDAISQALAYFDVGRAQLEIDIISDAKTGIFGLVGARKAQIKARRRESARKQMEAVREAVRATLEEVSLPTPQDAAPPQPATPAGYGPGGGETQDAEVGIAAQGPESSAAPGTPGDSDQETAATSRQEKSRRSRSRQKPSRKESTAGPAAEAASSGTTSSGHAVQPSRAGRGDRTNNSGKADPASSATVLPDLSDDQAESVKEQVQQMMEHLLAPLVGEPVLQLSMPEPGKILVGVDAGEDAGLLIGKEGGTLAALQYLANRILARHCDGPLPRVSMEAGNYKERQDDTLRQMALGLAEKARSTGKAQSTRPLSSYHRRVIHLALQEDDGIVTRSKGEGALKRVVILPKKASRAQPGQEGDAANATPDGSARPANGTQTEASANGGAEGETSKPRRPRRPRRRRGQGDAQRQAAGAESAASTGETGGTGELGEVGDVGDAGASPSMAEIPAAPETPVAPAAPAPTPLPPAEQ